MDLDLIIAIGLWTIITYVLCQYFYNKGHDDGMKYSSRVIGTTTTKKKVKSGQKKK